MTECLQTVIEISLERFSEKKNSYINFDLLCTIVKKVAIHTCMSFVILKNKQQQFQYEFILIIRTSRMNCPAKHVKKLGQNTIDIQFVFSGFAYYKINDNMGISSFCTIFFCQFKLHYTKTISFIVCKIMKVCFKT